MAKVQIIEPAQVMPGVVGGGGGGGSGGDTFGGLRSLADSLRYLAELQLRKKERSEDRRHDFDLEDRRSKNRSREFEEAAVASSPAGQLATNVKGMRSAMMAMKNISAADAEKMSYEEMLGEMSELSKQRYAIAAKDEDDKRLIDEGYANATRGRALILRSEEEAIRNVQMNQTIRQMMLMRQATAGMEMQTLAAVRDHITKTQQKYVAYGDGLSNSYRLGASDFEAMSRKFSEPPAKLAPSLVGMHKLRTPLGVTHDLEKLPESMQMIMGEDGPPEITTSAGVYSRGTPWTGKGTLNTNQISDLKKLLGRAIDLPDEDLKLLTDTYLSAKYLGQRPADLASDEKTSVGGMLSKVSPERLHLIASQLAGWRKQYSRWAGGFAESVQPGDKSQAAADVQSADWRASPQGRVVLEAIDQIAADFINDATVRPSNVEIDYGVARTLQKAYDKAVTEGTNPVEAHDIFAREAFAQTLAKASANVKIASLRGYTDGAKTKAYLDSIAASFPEMGQFLQKNWTENVDATVEAIRQQNASDYAAKLKEAGFEGHPAVQAAEARRGQFDELKTFLASGQNLDGLPDYLRDEYADVLEARREVQADALPDDPLHTLVDLDKTKPKSVVPDNIPNFKRLEDDIGRFEKTSSGLNPTDEPAQPAKGATVAPEAAPAAEPAKSLSSGVMTPISELIRRERSSDEFSNSLSKTTGSFRNWMIENLSTRRQQEQVVANGQQRLREYEAAQAPAPQPQMQQSQQGQQVTYGQPRQKQPRTPGVTSMA